MKRLIVIPLYNERDVAIEVLCDIRRFYHDDILIVNDGSSDGSNRQIRELRDDRIFMLDHVRNLGYGRSLIDGFRYAIENRYDHLVTMDADGQHAPDEIESFFRLVRDYDVVSGSRYREEISLNDAPPGDRLHINRILTEKLRAITSYDMTDAFCGYKAYRVAALRIMQEWPLDEEGYAFPLQFWIRAEHFQLSFIEIPVRRIYKDANRSFGSDKKGINLDDPEIRMRHYSEVLEREIKIIEKGLKYYA